MNSRVRIRHDAVGCLGDIEIISIDQCASLQSAVTVDRIANVVPMGYGVVIFENFQVEDQISTFYCFDDVGTNLKTCFHRFPLQIVRWNCSNSSAHEIHLNLHWIQIRQPFKNKTKLRDSKNLLLLTILFFFT